MKVRKPTADTAIIHRRMDMRRRNTSDMVNLKVAIIITCNK